MWERLPARSLLTLAVGGGDALAYLAVLNPTARAVIGGALGLLLGLLALSSMVTSSQYWRLTETEVRCRSLRVSTDWPRYVWDVRCGREPDVDICISTANIMIHAQCGTFRIREKISDYASRLKDSGFVQAHRCYVVRWVSVVEGHHAYVELEDGTRIPLGRRFRTSIAAGR